MSEVARAGVELEALRIPAILLVILLRQERRTRGVGAFRTGSAWLRAGAYSRSELRVKVAMLLSTLITVPSSQSSSGRGEKPRSNPNTVHPCASDATKQAQRDKGGYGGRIKQTVSGDFEEQVMEVYEPYHA